MEAVKSREKTQLTWLNLIPRPSWGTESLLEHRGPALLRVSNDGSSGLYSGNNHSKISASNGSPELWPNFEFLLF